MSMGAGRYQLANAFKSLKAEWNASQGSWRDIVRKEFAEQHFEPLEIRLVGVLTAMDRLDLALTKMKNECG
ncbi:MAG: hypothetical protein EXR98_22585 [Gemmataceae bacterium]|nr:hypothetical protein [Gemmataceae bacterium]